MLSQLVDAAPVSVRLTDYSEPESGSGRMAMETSPHIACDPEATRRIEIAHPDGIDLLRESDPAAADKIEAALAEMPGIGAEFAGFQLVLELGTGAFGRVFMAKQNALAGRLVALKLAADLNGETQRLAQLQHTNIMPIYSEHRSGNLHAVCMPYFGCTTLADMIKALRRSSLPTSGKHLVSTLFNRQTTLRENDRSASFKSGKSNSVPESDRTVQALSLPESLAAPAVLSKIGQMSYVDAVLWIGAKLAEGLAHAHERGIIHRDLKPANVLIADDGQPLLLDFNLAEDVKLRSMAAVAQVGGTLPYMSPEQLIAYRDGIGSIDGRGDIYALGLILYHLLTGNHAFPVRKGAARTIVPLMIKDREETVPTMRSKNRAISPALEAIVLRCLEVNPNRRYQSARDLAEDIERHRAHLPLKHTREPSLAERAAKWTRRHPRLASPATLSAMIAALLLLAISVGVHQSLESKQRELEHRRIIALERFHDFENEYYLSQDLLTSDDPIQLQEGARLAEKTLRNYGVLDRADWMEQQQVKELSPSDRERLKEQVGELAFLLARAAYFQPQKGGGDALEWNRLARLNLDGDVSQVVAMQREDLSGTASDATEHLRLREKLEQAEGLRNKARLFAACHFLALGQIHMAQALVKDAVRIDPNDFGGWAIKGRCHQLLDETADAEAAYSTAIALRPTHVRARLWRAELLLAKGKNLEQAKADLDVALKLQPNLLDAYIDRGLVLNAMVKHKEALEDLDWALQCPGVPSRVWFIRYRVKMALGDKEGAARDLAQGLKTEPTDPLSWVSRGYARFHSDPQAALADFAKAEELWPRCFEAVFNQACVLGTKLGKYEDAVAVLDRLLKRFPDDHRAASSRAIYLVRAGKFDEAVAAARRCVKLSNNSQAHYRAACVLALASKDKPALRIEALRLLATALTRGWGFGAIETDSDLKPLHDLAEFQQFLAFARAIKTWALPGAVKE
jgi:eukaryotic-like serine/threonine-protein kinase